MSHPVASLIILCSVFRAADSAADHADSAADHADSAADHAADLAVSVMLSLNK
jgi:hypothetical protein